MFSFNSFAAGFVLGFGSGVSFRSLAENEFEPIKDILRTSVGTAHKLSDSILETFGRLRENLQDLRAQARAERVKHSRERVKKERTTPSQKVSRQKKARPTARRSRVLHA